MIHWWKHNQLCYVVTFSYNPNEMDNCLTLVLLARSLFVGHPPLAIYWDWMLASLIMSITLIVDGGCPSSWTPLKFMIHWQPPTMLACIHILVHFFWLVNYYREHPWYLFVTRPATIPHVGRWWIVHISIAHILNLFSRWM